MADKKYVLKFPPRLVEKPIASVLVSEYGLVVNILRARVEPDEDGMLVVELTGEVPKIDAGVSYLSEIGVEIEPLSGDIAWREDRCTQCSACVNVCPTGALSAQRPEMTIAFDGGKCIACELCLTACPYAAVEVALRA